MVFCQVMRLMKEGWIVLRLSVAWDSGELASVPAYKQTLGVTLCKLFDLTGPIFANI